MTTYLNPDDVTKWTFLEAVPRRGETYRETLDGVFGKVISRSFFRNTESTVLLYPVFSEDNTSEDMRFCLKIMKPGSKHRLCLLEPQKTVLSSCRMFHGLRARPGLLYTHATMVLERLQNDDHYKAQQIYKVGFYDVSKWHVMEHEKDKIKESKWVKSGKLIAKVLLEDDRIIVSSYQSHAEQNMGICIKMKGNQILTSVILDGRELDPVLDGRELC